MKNANTKENEQQRSEMNFSNELTHPQTTIENKSDYKLVSERDRSFRKFPEKAFESFTNFECFVN